ncbi:MAG: protein kinase [Planctomycetota bacterium]|nr:protein kinase [Planctomycetota bacterium]
MRSNIVRDPYAEWLGIPRDQRPLTHYRLLGLDRRNVDAAVVMTAAKQQHQRLQPHLVGINNGKCVQLMKEIETARRVLINDESRRKYNIELKQDAIVAPVKRIHLMDSNGGGHGIQPLTTQIGGRDVHSNPRPRNGNSTNGSSVDGHANTGNDNPINGHGQRDDKPTDASTDTDGIVQVQPIRSSRTNGESGPDTNGTWPHKTAPPIANLQDRGETPGKAIRNRQKPQKPANANETPRPNPLSRGNSQSGDASVTLPEDSRLMFMEFIGQGSTTRVYRAFDRSAQRDVAVRQLVSESAQAETVFWNESRFLGGLHSEHVLAMYEVNPDRKWCVLELAEERLDQRLERNPLSPDEAVELLVQIAQALSHIHGRDFLYGDINPSCIYVTEEGHFKLGPSSGLSESGETLIPRSTRKHIPPEMISGDVFGKCGPQTDLYCLAHTVLEAILGPRHAEHFKGIGGQVADTMAWMKWHSSSTVALPPVEELGLGLPRDAAEVLDRMLRKKVKLRIGSASEVVEKLRPIASGGLIDTDGLPSAGTAEPTAEFDEGAVPVGARPDIFNNDDDFDETPLTWREAEYWIDLSKRPPVQIGLAAVVVLLLVAIVFWPQSDTRATVLFESTPPGAVVLVDTEKLPGVTPLQVKLKPGRCRIQFQLEGYQHESEPITVPQSTNTVTVQRTLKLAVPTQPGRNSKAANMPTIAGLEKRDGQSKSSAERDSSDSSAGRHRSPHSTTHVPDRPKPQREPVTPHPTPTLKPAPRCGFIRRHFVC